MASRKSFRCRKAWFGHGTAVIVGASVIGVSLVVNGGATLAAVQGGPGMQAVHGNTGRHAVREASWTGPIELDSGADSVQQDALGTSVALDAAGTVALVAPKRPEANVESFTSSDDWSQPTALEGSGNQQDVHPISTALSADGSMALVGQPNAAISSQEFSGEGALYTYAGGSWGTPAQLDLGSSAGAADLVGSSVALDASGQTALLGTPGRSVDGVPEAGAAEVYDTANLASGAVEVNGGGQSTYHLGASVALSADGNTALLGDPVLTVNGQTNAGAADVFIRVAGQWIFQQQLDLGTNAAADNDLGYSVALSADGKTALLGAFNRLVSGQARAGAAEVFRRGTGGWTFQHQLDLGPQAAANDNLGFSVAVSGNGNTALLGAPQRMVDGQTDAGALAIFTYAGGHWGTATQLNLGNQAAAYDGLGYAVAISADGHTVLAGAPNREVDTVTETGAAFLWTSPSTSVSICCLAAKVDPGESLRERIAAKIESKGHPLRGQTMFFVVGAAPQTVETCSALSTKKGVAACTVPDGFDWSGRVPVSAYYYGNATNRYAAAPTHLTAKAAIKSIVAVEGTSQSLSVYELKAGAANWVDGFASAGKSVVSQPAIAGADGYGYAVACQGPNNRLNVYEELGTMGWTSDPVPGTGIAYSAPAATIFDGKLWVFVEGPNNSLDLYWQTLGSTVWSSAVAIAGTGTTFTAPAVTTTAGGLNVATEGPSNTLDFYWESTGSFTFHLEQVASSGTESAPSIASQYGKTWITAEGTGNDLDVYWQTQDQSTWNPISTSAADGDIFSTPVITDTPTGPGLAVAAEGPSGAVEALWQSGAGSTTFHLEQVAGSGSTSVGPGVASVPHLYTDPVANPQTFVAVQGAGHKLNVYWQTQGTNTWHPVLVTSGMAAYSSPSVG